MAKNNQTISVSFELGPEDVGYFRERLRRVRDKRAKSEAAVIDAAAELVEHVHKSKPPAFVLESIEKLTPFIAMLRDEAWRLEGDDRAPVLDALAYFAEADDLIPDSTPGIGYLDDAIMIELVARELQPELDAYADFIDFCKARARADAAIASQREELQGRMRRRARRSGRGGGVGGSGGGEGHSPLSLF